MKVKDEIITKDEKIFTINARKKQVGYSAGITYQIWPKEQGYTNIPHCHALYQGYNISISLLNFSILEGFFPKNKEVEAIEYVKNHVVEIRRQWDDYHTS